MNPRIYVPPLGKAARLADILMMPVMRLVSGAPSEAPQQTHRWNNRKLCPEKLFAFDTEKMVRHPGIPGEGERFGIRFHIPLLNGWKRYIVIQPQESIETETWHIGWFTTDKGGYNVGVSRIPLSRSVRMLIGPERVSFFGVCGTHFTQIALEAIGEGSIGDRGPYSNIPLL